MDCVCRENRVKIGECRMHVSWEISDMLRRIFMCFLLTWLGERKPKHQLWAGYFSHWKSTRLHLRGSWKNEMLSFRIWRVSWKGIYPNIRVCPVWTGHSGVTITMPAFSSFVGWRNAQWNLSLKIPTCWFFRPSRLFSVPEKADVFTCELAKAQSPSLLYSVCV